MRHLLLMQQKQRPHLPASGGAVFSPQRLPRTGAPQPILLQQHGADADGIDPSRSRHDVGGQQQHWGQASEVRVAPPLQKLQQRLRFFLWLQGSLSGSAEGACLGPLRQQLTSLLQQRDKEALDRGMEAAASGGNGGGSAELCGGGAVGRWGD